MNLPIAEPLLQESTPSNARCGRKVLTLLPLFIGLCVAAVLLSPVPSSQGHVASLPAINLWRPGAHLPTALSKKEIKPPHGMFANMHDDNLHDGFAIEWEGQDKMFKNYHNDWKTLRKKQKYQKWTSGWIMPREGGKKIWVNSSSLMDGTDDLLMNQKVRYKKRFNAAIGADEAADVYMVPVWPTEKKLLYPGEVGLQNIWMHQNPRKARSKMNPARSPDYLHALGLPFYKQQEADRSPVDMPSMVGVH